MHFESICKTGRKYNDTRYDRHKCIQYDNMNRFSHQRTVFFNITAKDRHTAHSDRQRKKRLVHRTYDNRTVDLGKIRDQIKGQPLSRTL